MKLKNISAVVCLTLATLGMGASNVSALPTVQQHTDQGLQSLHEYYGRVSWSIDGAAEKSHIKLSPQTIRFEKPEGATVRQAWLISGDGGNRNNSGHPPLDVLLNGSQVDFSNWAKVTTAPGGESWNNFNSYWSDVTSLVSQTIDESAAGVHTLAFDQGDGTDDDSVEGGSLVVVYDDPSAPLSSIFLKVGTADPAGSQFSFPFPAISAENLNNDLLLSIGISNSYQSSYWEQSSNIMANGLWLSNVAGGCDDSASFATTGCDFGGYNTIGGVGDTARIPGNVDSEIVGYDRNVDNELYRLNSLINIGDTSLSVTTSNPSNNDNIYFAGVYLKGILPTADYCTVHALECNPRSATTDDNSLANTGSTDSRDFWLAAGLMLIGLGLILGRSALLQSKRVHR